MSSDRAQWQALGEWMMGNEEPKPIKLVLGIDPGAKGGLVALDPGLGLHLALKMPWRASQGLYLPDLIDALNGLKRIATDAGGRVFVVIEHQVYRPTDGGKGIFTTGRGFGQLEGLVAMGGMAYDTPLPNAGVNGWHRFLDGLPGADTKARAIAMVERRLPELDLRPGRMTKAHDGLADAAALAMYGIERFVK